MKNKILIGAGILLTVFIIFLIAICGGSSTDKIVTEEELKVTIENVTCQVNEEEDDITYQLGYLSNDIQFDNELQTKSYNKIIVNQKVDINFLGTAFMVKPTENATLTFTLTKNGESLKSTTLTLESDEVGNVDLLLENAVNFSASDELAIVISQADNISFVFDTMIFFFDEV
ncbi:MAG: hypothetical protein IKA31_03360 [Clostridia bacterium]|nr:hypothetical protein [Clostridia bacterium]MBR2507641.1 hypothetical protein [Bacilli bacterium]MBR4003620.1 hypothetical protein [Clostridia bacterium]